MNEKTCDRPVPYDDGWRHRRCGKAARYELVYLFETHNLCGTHARPYRNRYGAQLTPLLYRKEKSNDQR